MSIYDLSDGRCGNCGAETVVRHWRAFEDSTTGAFAWVAWVCDDDAARKHHEAMNRAARAKNQPPPFPTR